MGHITHVSQWSSMLWLCWFDRQEEHPTHKIEWWGAGVVTCLERSAEDLHKVQPIPLSPYHLLLHSHPEWFTFLIPAYPGCFGKRLFKRVFMMGHVTWCPMCRAHIVELLYGTFFQKICGIDCLSINVYIVLLHLLLSCCWLDEYKGMCPEKHASQILQVSFWDSRSSPE